METINEKLKQVTEKLSKDLYKANMTMPAYIDRVSESFMGYSSIPSFVPMGDGNQKIPFRKPIVLDTAVNEEKGLIAVIMKSQIDWRAEMGVQWAFTSHIADPSGEIKEVNRINLYDSEMKDEGSKIGYAKDLLPKS
jgi:hypothetical protein